MPFPENYTAKVDMTARMHAYVARCTTFLQERADPVGVIYYPEFQPVAQFLVVVRRVALVPRFSQFVLHEPATKSSTLRFGHPTQSFSCSVPESLEVIPGAVECFLSIYREHFSQAVVAEGWAAQLRNFIANGPPPGASKYHYQIRTAIDTYVADGLPSI